MNKIFKEKKPPSDTFRLGMLLSLVGGFVDAYTFIVRGKVLANAQTGNIIFFGLSLIEKKWEKTFFFFLPIFAFVIGILIAEFIRTTFKNSKIHWRQIIILIEILVLFICAFIPKGNLDVFVNISISFMCSLQVQAFRKINGNLSSTTMCTGNLRSASDFLYYSLFSKDPNIKKSAKKNTLIYFGLIIFFIIGAIMGSFFSELIYERAVLVASFMLLIIFVVMFKNEI